MEELIKQAFLHVEVIGPHVAEGHYDLVGPNGEIILPQVWSDMIEPDMSITMHMWPLPEPKPRGPPPGHPMHPGMMGGPGMGFDPRRREGGGGGGGQRPGPPPPPPGAPGGRPGPPLGAFFNPEGPHRPGPSNRRGSPPMDRHDRPGGVPVMVMREPKKKKEAPKGGLFEWVIGGKPPKKSSK